MQQVRIMARIWQWIGVLVALGACGCGSSSTLYVTKPISGTIDEYTTATVVTGGNGVKLSKAAADLREIITRKLEAEGVFDQVGPDGALLIHAQIQNMDDGKEVGRGLTLKGKAKVTVEFKITKPNGSVVGHVTATADSQREDDEDRPDLRVLEATATQLVKYLKEHKSDGAPEKKDKPAAKKKKP